MEQTEAQKIIIELWEKHNDQKVKDIEGFLQSGVVEMLMEMARWTAGKLVPEKGWCDCEDDCDCQIDGFNECREEVIAKAGKIGIDIAE